MPPLDLEREIFLAYALLAEINWLRASRLMRYSRRPRLAYLRDIPLAIEALESANRYWDLAGDAGRRIAFLSSNMSRQDPDADTWAALSHTIRLELGDDETRLRQSES